MDDLFVQRKGGGAQRKPRASREGSGSDRRQSGRDDRGRNSRDREETARDGARQLVEDMAREIVLDEDPEAEALSPDERRLRSAHSPNRDVSSEEESRERSEPSDRSRRSNEPSSERSGRQPVSAAPPFRGSPQPPAVDGLFAKRVPEPNEDRANLADADLANLADALLVRRPNEDRAPETRAPPPAAQDQRQNVRPPVANNSMDAFFMRPSTGSAPSAPADAAVEDKEDDEMTLEEAVANESSDGKRRSETRETKCCKLPSFSVCRPELIRYWVAAVGVAALMGLFTASLAMGCDDEAPLGQFCVAEGMLQWLVAGAPGLVCLLCTACVARRAYALRRQAKEASWQHDGEAQRSAADVLEALAAAPAEDRLKYARQVVQILKDFPDKAVIQHKGCLALDAICRAQKGNAVNVQAAGAVPVLLKALEKHQRVRAVQRAGLGALSCVAKVSRQQIFDLGGIPVILASMGKFKRDPAVQVSGSMTLGALCLQSAQNRKSVAKYGGVSFLLQTLERHVERADVLISASETIVLLMQGDAGMRKQFLPSLNVVQGIILRYESNLADETGRSGAKRIRDCEVVLRSLRKLEGHLRDLAADPDEDECSEVGTPRVDAKQESSKVAQVQTGQAMELQQRIQKWNVKKNEKR